MSNARRDFLQLLLLGGASLGLSACDGDKKPEGGGDKPSPATGGAKTPTSGDKGRDFRIGWSVWTGWMPFKLMAERAF